MLIGSLCLASNEAGAYEEDRLTGFIILALRWFSMLIGSLCLAGSEAGANEEDSLTTGYIILALIRWF
jgi:hypothetical protein